MRWLALLALLFISATPAKIHTLYTSLDPQSISEHLAFYQLYPNSPEGKQALNDAWSLISNSRITNRQSLPPIEGSVNALVSLITRDQTTEKPRLSSDAIREIKHAAVHLSNRSLKGYHAANEEEVLKLNPEEIDLARALFLSIDPDALPHYEAMIDLMALQIKARLPKKATADQKIDTINAFIFDEMGFRFPPQSLYSKEIDLYTFLPAVLDSRRGVCLGVSILYLCIGQRLDLPLEIITPPGHIYVRHKERNIETTARGVHIDNKEYLSLETRSLQERTMKEVVGMAHFNDAGRYWHTGEHEKISASYNKALPYMPDDMLLKELMGFNYLILGDAKGKELLLQTVNHLSDYAVVKEPMAEDLLNGNTDAEGVQTLFMHVDETLTSIKEKQNKLENHLKKYPNFRAGIFGLATTHLQLHRLKEAASLLDRYHNLDPTNPTVEYYLAAINTVRLDYNKAWKHYHNAVAITSKRNHRPEPLKELKQQLHLVSPQVN